MRALLLSAALLAAPALAQTTTGPAPITPPLGPPGVAASAVEGGVSVDGVLDEAAWAGAEVATGFVQNRPNGGDPASERTEARVLYDGGAVYVGLTMYDAEPDGIEAPLGRRDAELEGDWIFVAFDSYDDDRTAFAFAINPAGVQRDVLLFDDVRDDDSWDAVWDGATRRTDDGWTAEMRIPLSQLRYAGGRDIQEWGVQFHRLHHRTGEQTFWAPILPDDDGLVSKFGRLTDLRDLRAPRQLELLPYVASALTRAPGNAADPFYAANDVSPRVGLDVKYGLSSDLTLTATVNPDFGQVEADPAQVNLGGFELFFQERRPFFVEGTDVFSMEPRRFFGMNRPNLLYTRRIGRAPQRRGFVPGEAYDAAGPDGAVYSDAAQQSTILGAAKLSGRAGNVSFGVLNAVTGPEYGTFRAFDAAGAEVHGGRALVEPTTNYAAGRARGTFGNTIVGALGTSVVRSTADAAIAGLLPSQSTVLGLDVEHPLGAGWIATGQLAGSHVSGSADAIARLQTAFPRLYQRPDADHLTYDPTRTSLSGLTGEANLLKTSGSWVGSLHAGVTSPGFDANDLGFQSRADQIGVGSVIVYQQNQPSGILQRWSANTFLGSRWNTGGDHEVAFLGGNADATFSNFWGIGVNGELYSAGVSDRLTRGGPLAGRGRGMGLNINGRTDGRKKVSAFAWTGMNYGELGDRFNGFEVGIEARPSSSLNVSLSPELFLSADPRQYVGAFEAPGLDGTFGRRYVFGRIEQTTVALAARLNWTFTPTLSLQTYVRPFVSRGQYSGFRQMTEAGQTDFPVYGEGFGAVEALDVDAETGVAGAYRVTGADGGTAEFGNPNFTVRALQGNAVLRWEYRPGSALFLVWQQQRSGFARDGALGFDRDIGGLFRDEATNVFLLKLSYWLG